MPSTLFQPVASILGSHDAALLTRLRLIRIRSEPAPVALDNTKIDTMGVYLDPRAELMRRK